MNNEIKGITFIEYNGIEGYIELMKHDVKELENPDCKGIELCYNGKDIKAILDYITNLQEELKSANESITWWTNRFKVVEKENEKLNKRLEMLFKKEYPFIVENGIICRKNKEIENLQKENKHLKDLYNQALKDYDELLKEQ